MSRKYHSLLVRSDGRWGIEFGDYDRETVEQEKLDAMDGRPFADFKIVTTGEAQADIDAAVAELNAGAAQ